MATRDRFPILHPILTTANCVWNDVSANSYFGVKDTLVQCAEFMQFVLRDEILSGCYFEYSGQPSLVSSWESGALNKQSNNFFLNNQGSPTNQKVLTPLISWTFELEQETFCFQ